MLQASGPVQDTYTQYLTVGQPGVISDMHPSSVDTAIAEDPHATGIPFGRAVSHGTLHGDRSACLGNLSGSHFYGLTVAEKTIGPFEGSTTDTFADGSNMGVMVEGDMWVLPSDDHVTAGGAVHYDATTGELASFGGTLIKSAVWMTTPADDPRSGGLAMVRLTKPADPNS